MGYVEYVELGFSEKEMYYIAYVIMKQYVNGKEIKEIADQMNLAPEAVEKVVSDFKNNKYPEIRYLAFIEGKDYLSKDEVWNKVQEIRETENRKNSFWGALFNKFKGVFK